MVVSRGNDRVPLTDISRFYSEPLCVIMEMTTFDQFSAYKIHVELIWPFFIVLIVTSYGVGRVFVYFGK